jgi:NADH-quinone oxidoreductase subunit M
VWVIITLASIGLPGTGGFVGELMVITGTMVSSRLRTYAAVDAGLAAAGVILGAVYMLKLTERAFFGPLSNPKNRDLPDLTMRETLVLAPLVLLVFVIGLFPSLLLDRMKDSVQATIEHYNMVWIEGRTPVLEPRLLAPESDPGLARGAPPRAEETP